MKNIAGGSDGGQVARRSAAQPLTRWQTLLQTHLGGLALGAQWGDRALCRCLINMYPDNVRGWASDS